MAESGKVEIVGKPVQDLVLNSENQPKNYIYKEGGGGFRDAQDDDIPVIHLHRLSSPSTAQQELAKLHHALNSWGCFQEEKQKCAREREPNNIEGYDNDIIYSENQRLDWTDRVYLKVLPEDQRKFKFWPQNPNDFSYTFLSPPTLNECSFLHEEYCPTVYRKYKAETEVIIKAMTNSLNLEEDCFLNECGERDVMFLRFNYYPPCPMPDHVLGLKPHADGSTITFLLQDKLVQGLQGLKYDQWFKVPIILDALVINVGDQTEILSNGIFRSPIHRAVINSEKERLTVAIFCLADSEKEIKPVKNYSEIYFQYYHQGKRPIEASKI
uniref:Fe2OG dioxygenase domain-containing protein n=1 Tax=Glycine max TaxID=3847 RepID=A0A0R0JA54_SOYBN